MISRPLVETVSDPANLRSRLQDAEADDRAARISDSERKLSLTPIIRKRPYITEPLRHERLRQLTIHRGLCRLPTMVRQPRLSAQTLKVLVALMQAPLDEMSGAEIGRSAKLASGTLYPILLRLENAGWLKSRWEVEDPQSLGRPRRRFYRVTALGEKNVEAALRQFEPAIRRFAWT